MTKLLLAAALLFTACVDETTEPGQRTIEIDEDVISHGLTSDQVDLCSRTVAADGPCAVACDPEEVMKFVPPESCALFVCGLEDGGAINIGGCNTAKKERPVLTIESFDPPHR